MLVSCVMPTRGRQDWALSALQSFLSQDYTDRELVILDDEDEPSFREPERLPQGQVRYVRGARPETLAVKRNIVNDLAHGDLICHYDSDDWSDRARISHQVAVLQKRGNAVTGFNRLLFYEPSTGKVARYIGNSNYACGSSLLYRKSFWAANPFRRPEKPVTEYGSDNIFVRAAQKANEIVATGDHGLMVARIHPGNTSPNQMYKMHQQLSVADLPERFPR